MINGNNIEHTKKYLTEIANLVFGFEIKTHKYRHHENCYGAILRKEIIRTVMTKTYNNILYYVMIQPDDVRIINSLTESSEADIVFEYSDENCVAKFINTMTLLFGGDDNSVDKLHMLSFSEAKKYEDLFNKLVNVKMILPKTIKEWGSSHNIDINSIDELVNVLMEKIKYA